MILQYLEPERVFHYFEEITRIPRGSGNSDKIIEYCVNFAKKHSLEYVVDEIGNVLISKPASAGYDKSEGIVLQGHMDMVCVNEVDKHIDFEKEGVSVCTDGDLIWADGTSLGADDGIALAFIFAILESDAISHPHLEALLTVDEEIGLIGAGKFDTSLLKGKKLINLDSEVEGILTVSCAGGVRALCTLPVSCEKPSGVEFKLIVDGLKGGHSGIEIDKNRTNAIKLIGRLLNHFNRTVPLRLSKIKGGLKENAIPNNASVDFFVPNEYVEVLLHEFLNYQKLLKKELSTTEPNFDMYLTRSEANDFMMSEKNTSDIIYALYHAPYGVVAMNPELSGLVQTSLNVGIIDTKDSEITMKYSIRSSVSSEKEELKNKLVSFFEHLGGTIEFMADYPAWEYLKDSPLRDTAVLAYQKIYREKPQVLAIHAGLECGIFVGSCPELDCISFGPELRNVHTTKECMPVDSVARTWNFLLEILKLSI